jgi:hypothetical protein
VRAASVGAFDFARTAPARTGSCSSACAITARVASVRCAAFSGAQRRVLSEAIRA